MFIVNNRKIFYAISAVLVGASIVALTIWGLNLSIDFKGGAIIEISYSDGRPMVSDIEKNLEKLNLGEHSIRPVGETGFLIRTRELEGLERADLLKALSDNDAKKITEERFDSVGPLLGKEAMRKSLFSIIFVIICIVLFITFAFRKVSEPVASWKYGLITVLALIHDVLIPAGVFAILGRFQGVEVDTLFVTALLVVLGFSVHDTIVVFDRVRENLKVNRETRGKKPFEQIVGESISQTFVRSINTSLTTILVLIVLFFVGADTTKLFSLALIIGITAGTYSSIFVGSTLLVTAEKLQHK
ncbi:MAG: Protein translocase subunit SecF [Parcubacteria group bacterium GW2011_GWB1_43_6]|nr:MAG: Protein translocase subunit SecF [Parcubacteria group bacterium GW2011_GWB1_43_6]